MRVNKKNLFLLSKIIINLLLIIKIGGNILNIPASSGACKNICDLTPSCSSFEYRVNECHIQNMNGQYGSSGNEAVEADYTLYVKKSETRLVFNE